MASLNKVMLIGNLTRDPEVRYTPRGTAVTEIGLAVNRNFTTDDGDRREETTFVDVTVWGRQAEVIGQYMKKGRPIFVEGRLQLDTWDDKNTGQKRSKLRVVAEGFQFLGGKDDNQGGGGGGYSQSAPPQQQPQSSGFPDSQPQRQAPPQQQAPLQASQPQQQAPPAQQPAAQAPPQSAPPQQAAPPQAAPSFDDEDDDIPF